MHLTRPLVCVFPHRIQHLHRAVHAQRSAKIVQHAPYKRLPEERVHPLVLRLRLRLQVQHQDPAGRHSAQESLGQRLRPEGKFVDKHPVLQQPHGVRIDGPHGRVYTARCVRNVLDCSLGRLHLVERVTEVDVILAAVQGDHATQVQLADGLEERIDGINVQRTALGIVEAGNSST